MAYAALVKHHGFRQKILNLGMAAASSALRHAHWNRDWKPGPYPRTPEERAAAAKKYGLLPEDYEPFPEEEGYGDYPNLPLVSAEARDPFELMDHQAHRRNFAEPMNVHADMLGEDRYNINFKPKVPYKTQILWFLGVMSGSAALYLLGEEYKLRPTVMPKQLYGDGQKHYTFEPDT